MSYTIIPQVSKKHGVSQVSGSLQTPKGNILINWDTIKGTYVITTPILAKVKIGVPLEEPLEGGCGLEQIIWSDGRVVWENGKVADFSHPFVMVFPLLFFPLPSSLF